MVCFLTFPAGTQYWNNVESTLIQRQDVLTANQRWFNVKTFLRWLNVASSLFERIDVVWTTFNCWVTFLCKSKVLFLLGCRPKQEDCQEVTTCWVRLSIAIYCFPIWNRCLLICLSVHYPFNIKQFYQMQETNANLFRCIFKWIRTCSLTVYKMLHSYVCTFTSSGSRSSFSLKVLDNKFWIRYLPSIFVHLTLYPVHLIKCTSMSVSVNVSRIATSGK